MRTSFVVTVINEENTIVSLLDSLLKQSKIPDEIVIVDGGSTDRTVESIRYKVLSIKPRIKFKLFIKPGNRSIGRNEAIRRAKGDVILISDAGCILDRRWVEEITEPFKDKAVDVVAGYYKGKSRSIFEKCLVPYVLVMPDKLKENEFLPSTRSMALRKSAWKKVGGFPEKFSNNEDYVFANTLKKRKVKIVFQKEAVVHWIPRKNIKQAFVMFYRFAKGDAQAKLLRSKVLLIFARYSTAMYLFLLSFLTKSYVPLFIMGIFLFFYILFAVGKNYRYVQNREALLMLPVIQFTSDIAVLFGTSIGYIKSIRFNSIRRFLYQNKKIGMLVIIYVVCMSIVITWGIPGENHPFTYHMDEWHQMQAVRAVFTYGTPNVEGAAHGPMFHFLLSGILLIPSIFFGFVNPLDIHSSVTNVEMQKRLFIALRLETLFFGAMTILLLTKIIKDNFNTNPFWGIFFFVISPIWLSLSTYFKYDIALIFWITASIFFMLRYAKNPSLQNYLLTGVVVSLALATKFSAIPLVLIYIALLFLFPIRYKVIVALPLGLLSTLCIFLLVGIPDMLFGKGNYQEFLYSNIISFPSGSSNFILGMHYWMYLFIKQFPLIFGHASTLVFIVSLTYIFISLIKDFRKKNYSQKIEFFLLFSFSLFIASLIPLKLTATGNRALVLLPFITLLIVCMYKRVYKSLPTFKRYTLTVFLFFCLVIQMVESYAWISMKLSKSPQEISSEWIKNNIAFNSVIGIENIPIYQSLPDIVVKEFYNKQYNIPIRNRYQYKIISVTSKELPPVVIIVNGEIALRYQKKSDKKDLLIRLKNEKYTAVKRFFSDMRFFKYFGDTIDFYIAGLAASPVSIDVFLKE